MIPGRKGIDLRGLNLGHNIGRNASTVLGIVGPLIVAVTYVALVLAEHSPSLSGAGSGRACRSEIVACTGPRGNLRVKAVEIGDSVGAEAGCRYRVVIGRCEDVVIAAAKKARTLEAIVEVLVNSTLAV